MAVAARRDARMRVAEYRDWAAARPDDARREPIDGAPAYELAGALPLAQVCAPARALTPLDQGCTGDRLPLRAAGERC